MNKPLLLLFIGLLVLPNAISASCGLANDNQLIFRISGITNAHAELWNQNNYLPAANGIEICYNTIFGSQYAGAGPHSGNTILKASAATNAHVERPDLLNYTTNIQYGDLVCTYGATCDTGAGEICIATISGMTNAHVATCAGPAPYATKICCGSAAAVPVPNCFVSSVDSPIALNGSTNVAVSYFNFVPAGAGHVIACGDGAVPGAVSCAAGTCSFTCGSYSPANNYTIAVQLANNTGGSVDCGGSTVVVSAGPVPDCSSLTAVPASGVGPFTSVLTAAFSNSEGLNIDFDCDGDGTAEGQAAVSGGSASYDCGYSAVPVVRTYTASATESGSNASCTTSVTVNPVPVIPSCFISVDSPIALNGSTNVAVSYFNFVPAGAGHVIACGDGAVPGAVSCAAGTCSFTCGSYSPAGDYSVSVRLADSAGGFVDCGSGNVAVNAPAGSGPYLRLTKIDFEPKNFGGDAPPDFAKLDVTVKNFGDPTNASIGIEVFESTDFFMTSGTEFAFSQAGCGSLARGMDCTKSLEEIDILSLAPGSYKLVIKAYDGDGIEHDSESVFFVVIGTVPVPELDLLLLPLVAFSVLALLFYSRKQKA